MRLYRMDRNSFQFRRDTEKILTFSSNFRKRIREDQIDVINQAQ